MIVIAIEDSGTPETIVLNVSMKPVGSPSKSELDAANEGMNAISKHIKRISKGVDATIIETNQGEKPNG